MTLKFGQLSHLMQMANQSQPTGKTQRRAVALKLYSHSVTELSNEAGLSIEPIR